MVTESFRKWRDLYKAALSAGLESLAAQQWADNAVMAIARPIPARVAVRRPVFADEYNNYWQGSACNADRYADDY